MRRQNLFTAEDAEDTEIKAFWLLWVLRGKTDLPQIRYEHFSEPL
jgi:hypothetical protein